MRAATFATHASVGSYVGERGPGDPGGVKVERTPASAAFFVATAAFAAFCGLGFPTPACPAPPCPAPFLTAFLTPSAFLGAWPMTPLPLLTCACVPPFFGMLPEPKKILFLLRNKIVAGEHKHDQKKIHNYAPKKN
jgi:hypothetical protein